MSGRCRQDCHGGCASRRRQQRCATASGLPETPTPAREEKATGSASRVDHHLLHLLDHPQATQSHSGHAVRQGCHASCRGHCASSAATHHRGPAALGCHPGRGSANCRYRSALGGDDRHSCRALAASGCAPGCASGRDHCCRGWRCRPAQARCHERIATAGGPPGAGRLSEVLTGVSDFGQSDESDVDVAPRPVAQSGK